MTEIDDVYRALEGLKKWLIGAGGLLLVMLSMNLFLWWIVGQQAAEIRVMQVQIINLKKLPDRVERLEETHAIPTSKR